MNEFYIRIIGKSLSPYVPQKDGFALFPDDPDWLFCYGIQHDYSTMKHYTAVMADVRCRDRLIWMC